MNYSCLRGMTEKLYYKAVWPSVYTSYSLELEEGMIALAVHGRLQGGGGVFSNLEDG